ncbi:MAG TPA: ABC transporter permease [Longimicrobiales bacterium]
MSAIYILWLRQLKRYLRSRARIVGSIGQPLLFLIALGFGFGPVYARAGGGNFLQFLAPGIIAMTILFTAVFSGVELLWDKQFGFLKETLVAPVSRVRIVFGRTLGGATVATMQGVIVLLIALLAGFRPALGTLPLALLFAVLTGLLFTALGTMIASMIEDMQGFQLIMNFLVMPLFFLSGALFPLKGLPRALDYVVRANPFAYGVDGLRWALIGEAHFPLMVDLGVLTAITLLLLGVGAWLFTRIEV